MIDLIEKNKEYILDIVSQGYEGEGVAKIRWNFSCIYSGALVGEKVKVKIIKAKKKLCIW